MKNDDTNEIFIIELPIRFQMPEGTLKLFIKVHINSFEISNQSRIILYGPNSFGPSFRDRDISPLDSFFRSCSERSRDLYTSRAFICNILDEV